MILIPVGPSRRGPPIFLAYALGQRAGLKPQRYRFKPPPGAKKKTQTKKFFFSAWFTRLEPLARGVYPRVDEVIDDFDPCRPVAPGAAHIPGLRAGPTRWAKAAALSVQAPSGG